MDPGPWSPYTYNGLSASGVGSAPGTFAATAAGQRAVADFQAMNSQPGASQLLQLAGMSGMSPAAVAAAANSSFLSSNYEPVFSSLFHHSAQKSQYGALNVAHHRQSLVKPGDSELTAALRDNYMHQSVATSTAAALYEQTSPLNWSQASSSLGSPFGVLPHESVSGSSKSSGSEKKGHVFAEGATPPYENTFSAHLSPPFAHGYTNSQLSAAAADFRNSSNPSNFESKKVQKSTSHDIKGANPATPWQGAFSQVNPAGTRECSSLPPPPATSYAASHAQKAQAAANFASRSAAAAAIVSSPVATAHQQQTSQTCIVSRPSHHQVPPNLPFVPQHRPSSVPAPMAQEKSAPRSAGFSAKTGSHVPTKAQSKGFPSGPLDASVNSTAPLDSSQSPRYGLEANHNFSSSSAGVTPAASSSKPNIPQAHQRPPYPNPNAAHMAQYRNFPSPDGSVPGGPVSHASEYQRSTPDSIALSPYSDSEPQHCHPQNGGSSSSSGLGRPSPTQTSPLSHTPSPAYPIYNSPMSAPSPLHEAQSCVYSKPNPPPQQSAAYPSVIQCNTSQVEAKQVSHSRQNFPHSLKQSWEMQEKIARGVREMSQSNAPVSRFPYATESMEVLDEGMLAANENISQQRQSIYESSSTINMQDLAGGPSNEELLAREAEAEEYDRRRGRKYKRRKSGEKVKAAPQNCGYPAIQNGYFPSAYHENLMARNALGGYHHHPRIGFNPTPAHAQCGPNAMYQMGPLPLSVQQQGPTNSPPPPPPAPQPPEKPPLQGPSVDDELGFLEDLAPTVAPPAPVNIPVIKPSTSKDSSGFMDSYLKFLRGETETPITISARAGRKSPKVSDTPRKSTNSNTKIVTPASRNQPIKVTNSITATVATAATSTVASAPKPCLPFQQVPTSSLPQPCDTKKHQEPLRPDMPSCYLEDKRPPHKEICPEPAMLMNVDMRSRAAAEVKAREDLNSHRIRGRPPKRSAPHQEELTEVAPTRLTSQRKAKDAVIQGNLGELSDGEEPVDPDSDSDPAWMPSLAEANEDFSVKKGWQAPSKIRDSPDLPEIKEAPKIIKRKKKSFDTLLAEQHAKSRRIQTVVGSGSDSDATEPSSEVRRTKRPTKKRFSYKDPVRLDEVPTTPVKAPSPKPRLETIVHDVEKQQLFVSGAFIIPRTEFNDESPTIWRIDGRTLIQKFEAYDEDGKIYYRNVSTYSGWTPENYVNYEIADVMFIKNTREETIIHLNKDDVWRGVEALKKRFMVELEDYLDPFRTYLQTLASQVLDSKFISVILSENDEYFVSTLSKLDNLFEKKRSQMRNAIQLKGNTEELIHNWPSYDSEPLEESEDSPICATCESAKASVLLTFKGQCYEKTTLAITQVLDDGSHSMEFNACKICEPYIDLYSRLVHLKFNYFKLCAVKVQEIQEVDPDIDTNVILQTILQQDWIDKLFHGLQDFFAKIELIVFSCQAMADTD